MNLKDGSTVVADLTTTGRKSGLPRTVELRFLFFKGNFYATSTRVQGKHWCQNMIANGAVRITAKGETIACSSRQVTDDALRKQILTLRDSPPQLERVVFQITPNQ
jgi:deazaflavin-dependent oxidoreductase (nitroreductase family)